MEPEEDLVFDTFGTSIDDAYSFGFTSDTDVDEVESDDYSEQDEE